MIGITISNSEPLMPAIGGAEKIIGNNPIAIAAPTKNMPVWLDMALSNVPLGKSLAAKENMIGITISNSEPLMPAIGGAEKIIGNNPIAIAAPTKNMPVLLDMALSNVPLGKILAAKSNGISVPKGWGVDKYGEETT